MQFLNYVCAALILVVVIPLYVKAQKFDVISITCIAMLPVVLWLVIRSGRSRIAVYKEGILLSRPRRFGVYQTYIPFQSIKEVQADFVKFHHYELLIILNHDVTEFFGPCTGRAALFEFLSLMSNLMGKKSFDAKTLAWFQKQKLKSRYTPSGWE